MLRDPPNELLLETQNRIWWFVVALFLTIFVNFLTAEYKKHQLRLNERARETYEGRR